MGVFGRGQNVHNLASRDTCGEFIDSHEGGLHKVTTMPWHTSEASKLLIDVEDTLVVCG
ncbi:hypothetical protein HNR39_001576 [Glaciimonas immobilis]|uniref:Uncharacterized protein n=1 Tax=Glaciimonas immobilis TaxID=728004 RepID=A0A840RSS9_9BURK|nr:hypothetical protein [Glaciimonas immobilis]